MRSRRVWAALAAVTMVFSAYSCGKDDKKTSEPVDSAVSSEDTTTSKKSSKKTDTTEEKTTVGDITTAAKSDDKKDSKSATTTKAGEKKADTTTAAKSGGTASGSSSDGGSSNSGSSDNNGGSSSQEGGSGDNGSDGEAKEYTAEITLGASPSVKGSNVTVSGSTVTITKEGDYIFSGNVSEGQIIVRTGVADTEDKVTLVLNGVDISNSSQPAIFIEECKHCSIKSKDGTINYISSGVEKKDNSESGAIFSNDSLKFKGKGELNITSTASHGIKSDDDVVIDSGTYNIESRKSGIIANADVTVNDGNININAGTNGIKSKGEKSKGNKGTLHINGGRIVVSGGTKEEKSSIYVEGAFEYTGGYVYAAGNKVYVPTNSATPYIVADLGETVSGGSSVEMFLDGKSMVSMTPQNEFRCLMMLAPEVSSGSKFTVSVNGEGSKEFTVDGSGNEFKLK